MSSQHSDDELRTVLDWSLMFASARAAARESGIPRTTFQRMLKEAHHRGLEPTGDDPRSEFLTDGEAQTAERIGGAASHLKGGWKFDYDEDGNKLGSHRYSISAPELNPDIVTAAILDGLTDVPKAKITKSLKRTDSDLCSVIPIFDAHIGMLAHDEEVGESYDSKIAVERIRSGVERLIASAPMAGECVIIFGGDTMHVDDQNNATPASKHQLDADTRYYRILSSAMAAVRMSVDLALKRAAHVTLRILRGNHDPHSHRALTLGALGAYENEPRVSVDTGAVDFFHHEFGVNFLLAHHGDKAKPQQLVMFAADEWAESWGRTKHRRILTGHVHHDRVQDIGGATWESMRATTSRDAYAFSHGYVGRPALRLMVNHVSDGEIQRHTVHF